MEVKKQIYKYFKSEITEIGYVWYLNMYSCKEKEGNKAQIQCTLFNALSRIR